MVVVDYARILLFHRLTESATMMSIQSVLSSYDEPIYRHYGLFGRGGTDSNQLFRESLSLNHATNINLFSLYGSTDLALINFGQASVVNDHYLGEHEVFEQQVLEEMKYKAPIEFSLEVLETWTQLTEGVTQANQMMVTMNKLEELFHEREQFLEQALDLHTQLGVELTSSSYYTNISTKLGSVVNSYSSYTNWITYESNVFKQLENEHLTEEEREALEKELSRYSSQISSYLKSYQSIARQLQGYEQQLQQTHNQIAEAIIEKINASSALNNTIKIQYELYMNQQSSVQLEAEQSSIASELSQLTFSDDGLVRDPLLFKNYKLAIETQKQALTDYFNQMNNVMSMLNTAINSANHNSTSSIKQSQLNNELDKSKVLLQTYQANYSSPGHVLNEWREQVISVKAIKEQLKQDQSTFDNEIKDVKALFQAMTNNEELEKYRAPYKEIEQKAEANLANQALAHTNDGYRADEHYESGRKQAQAAASQLQSVLKLISDFGAATRDHVYINEYIMHRFTYFPFGEADTNDNKFSVEWLDYRNQEVEYIVYGMSEPMSNVALAYGEIFAFRFAIRTIEGLIANRVLGNPLLIFSAAVVHGVREAAIDMKQLLSEGDTQLSKYIPVPIDYKNYLRLFLLLHVVGKEKKYARAIAIIEQNLGVSLMNVSTAITGEVTSTFQLWSLPSIASAVNALLPMQSRIRGNTYEKKDTFTASY